MFIIERDTTNLMNHNILFWRLTPPRGTPVSPLKDLAGTLAGTSITGTTFLARTGSTSKNQPTTTDKGVKSQLHSSFLLSITCKSDREKSAKHGENIIMSCLLSIGEKNINL